MCRSFDVTEAVSTGAKGKALNGVPRVDAAREFLAVQHDDKLVSLPSDVGEPSAVFAEHDRRVMDVHLFIRIQVSAHMLRALECSASRPDQFVKGQTGNAIH